MKKILVPIDFSGCSDNALRNAIVLAEKMHMELILMHSYVIPVAMAEMAPGLLTQEIERAEKNANDQFDDLEAKFPDLKEVHYIRSVDAVPLLDSVREIVKQHDVAFVVMVTHGASGIQKVLGSNAYSIMKHVKCPVIALPEKSDISHMKHIALGGDYSNIPSHDSIQPLIDLAKAFYAELKVVHIDRENRLEDKQMEMARGMEKYLKPVRHSFHFRKDYDVEDGLLLFAKEHQINLLVMISRHHGFLDRLLHGSETKRMMLDIQLPLMVMHE
jgi:nucleotide-binding universal stress UspA family protein